MVIEDMVVDEQMLDCSPSESGACFRTSCVPQALHQQWSGPQVRCLLCQLLSQFVKCFRDPLCIAHRFTAGQAGRKARRAGGRRQQGGPGRRGADLGACFTPA